MKDNHEADESRRSFINNVGGLALGGLVAPALIASRPAHANDTAPGMSDEYNERTAQRSLDSLESAYGIHPAQRRNHTKGIGFIGQFTGTSEARRYSRSLLFRGAPTEVIGRFSLAGGDPDAADTERSTRGVGLQFRLSDGSLQHMTMLHTPMFFATMPQTFIDKFFALTPDPKTGKPDPAVFKKFLDTHPDNAAQAHYLAQNNPTASFANCPFFGIHTFYFINEAGDRTMVRWRFQPKDGVVNLTDAELETKGPNFLHDALKERIKKGPIEWDMMVTLGEPGDSVTNPTVLWPTERREFRAGTLTIHSVMDQEKAPSYGINYDPLVMAEGITASDDPILLFRSQSYGLSYSRRLRHV
jgi:catalase